MNIEKVFGISFIIIGIYSILRYKYNGTQAVKNGIKLAKIIRIPLLLDNPKHKLRKSDITYSQYSYIIAGIFFIVVGILSLFK